MPRYVKQEELVHDLEKRNDVISFTMDLLDEDVAVNLSVKGEIVRLVYSRPLHPMSPGGEDATLTFPIISVRQNLTAFLERFLAIRDEKVEFYNEDATPATPLPRGSLQRTDSGDITMADGQLSDMSIDEYSECEGEGELGDDELVVELDMDAFDVEQIVVEDSMLTGGDEMMSRIESPFVIVNESELVELSEAAVATVAERLLLPKRYARLVLRSYKWKVESITNRFFDTGREDVLDHVGLLSLIAPNPVPSVSRGPPASPTSSYCCPNCFCDVPFSDTSFLRACPTHRFCNDCWVQYIRVKICDGAVVRCIPCMGRMCGSVLDDDTVSSFIGPRDPNLLFLYRKKLLETYILDNASLKWCQSQPFCGSAACVRGVSLLTPLEIVCTCGSTWCFSCLNEPHLPASCVMRTFWKRKHSNMQHEIPDESETDDWSLRWIQTNTQECPECHKPTEKDGGCNHIRCPCGAHWCWVCGNTRGSAHSCGRFFEGPDDARPAVDRYAHYFAHFNAHHFSIKHRKKIQFKMEAKIHEILRNRPDSDLVEFQWLQEAMEVLFETRRALMWSYAFAYYFLDFTTTQTCEEARIGCRTFQTRDEREAVKNQFEDKQEILETTVERLNRLLDLPLRKLLMENIKNDIMVTAMIAQSYLHTLFVVIREDMILFSQFPLPEPRVIVTSRRSPDGDVIVIDGSN